MPLLIDLYDAAGTKRFTFNDGATYESAVWWADRIEGWDAPDLRLSTDGRIGVHGLALGENLYGGRPIILGGIAKATTAANVWAALNGYARYTDFTAGGGFLEVQEDDGTTKRAYVIRGGRPKWRLSGGSNWEWELPLLALDPRKYGATEASTTLTIAASGTSATGTVTNGGTFRSPHWTVTLTGTGTNPTIRNSTDAAKTIQINGVFVSGDTIVVNRRLRTVTLNGVDRYDMVDASTQWWDLLPGANTIVVSRTNAPANTETFVIAERDAWI